MNPDDPQWLQRAGTRVRSRTAFLGWILARYEVLEAIQEETLREQFQLSPHDWARLQLCLRPRAGSFLKDVTEIAQVVGIDRLQLARIVRRVEAVEAAREHPGQAGSLLAARSRKPGSSTREATDDDKP